MKVLLTEDVQAIRREFIPKQYARKLAGDTLLVVGQHEDEDGEVFEVVCPYSGLTWMVSEGIVEEVIE